VQVQGAQKYAVRVRLDPQKLAAKQIGMNEVEGALRNWNVNMPTGTMYGPDRSVTLRADGQLTSAADFRKLIVVNRGGSPVRLEELGNVIDSVEDDKSASWLESADSVRRSIILESSDSQEPTRLRWRTPSKNCCRCSGSKFRRRS